MFSKSLFIPSHEQLAVEQSRMYDPTPVLVVTVFHRGSLCSNSWYRRANVYRMPHTLLMLQCCVLVVLAVFDVPSSLAIPHLTGKLSCQNYLKMFLIFCEANLLRPPVGKSSSQIPSSSRSCWFVKYFLIASRIWLFMLSDFFVVAFLGGVINRTFAIFPQDSS